MGGVASRAGAGGVTRRTLLSRLPLLATLPWVVKRAGVEPGPATKVLTAEVIKCRAFEPAGEIVVWRDSEGRIWT